MTEQREAHPLSTREQAVLVQLADGKLTGATRARAESRARAIPDADRLIERQRRVARALGGADARAGVAPPRAAGARRLLPRLAPAAMLVFLLVLLAILAPGGDRSTVERAADLAQAKATAQAPRTTGAVLRAGVQGVRFPDWGAEFGWHETGMRRDVLDGRPTTTVFYEHTGHRLAYTIVSGAPLPRPAGGRVVRRDGLEIALYRDPGHGGHDIAVFERGGRTCVLAGHVRTPDTLLKLAAWKADGRLRS
jgi:hypothetical protein